jgi:hypothetical protein
MTIASFIPLRTKRFEVQLRELTLREGIELAQYDPARHEAAMGRFCSIAVQRASGDVADSARWTVQERTMVLVHYLACVSEDGPDFSVGEGWKLSDYFIGNQYPCDTVKIGERTFGQLSGVAAEEIESSGGGRRAWFSGAMAAQLIEPGATVPDPALRRLDYGIWLRGRVDELESLPESQYAELLAQWSAACAKLGHFFTIAFDASGIVALPKEAGGDTPPARFPVASTLSRITQDLL